MICFLLPVTAVLFAAAVFMFVWALLVIYHADCDCISEKMYGMCVKGLYAYAFSFWGVVLSVIALKLNSIGVSCSFLAGAALLFDLLTMLILSGMIHIHLHRAEETERPSHS